MSGDGDPDVHLPRPRRADAPPDPRPPAGRRAAGGRARDEAAHQPAGRVQAPPRAARGRAGRGPPRRPAALLPRAPRAARRDRPVARAVPAPVGHTARRARAPPRRHGGPMTSPYGTLTTREDGIRVLHYERRLTHPIEKVWAALTDPDQIEGWLARA